MPSPSNLSQVNNRTDLNSEGSVFLSNYLQPGFEVSPHINEATISYFEKITDNQNSALVLASCLVYTSLAQNIDPRETLDRIKNMSSTELSAYASMFLNLNRVGTSYLGVTNRPKVSKYVTRTILP